MHRSFPCYICFQRVSSAKMLSAKDLGATMKSAKWVWRVIEIVCVLSLITDQAQAMDSAHGVGLDKERGGCGNRSAAIACADEGGKRWAVLVAGSNGYSNYRHQADVCHAYQVLNKGGVEDENIIVFMYDDIAFSPRNPRPGMIINKPNGEDVYHGVLKDYTGDDVNAENFYAVLLGNKSAVTGGSGKVLDTGPNDHVFIYYADHGSPGIIGMPGGFVYANDLIEVLKKMHEAKTYKSMLIYIEACEAGSLFDGLLPNNISIYATTASDPTENSFGIYCPGDYPPPPSEYDTCLGDTYSVSWMEDCDKHDRKKETVKQQYEVVRRRTLAGNEYSSHVKHYGDETLAKNTLYTYMGAANSSRRTYSAALPTGKTSLSNSVSQRDATLVHLRQKLLRAPSGSQQQREAQEQLNAEISRREWEDNTISQIGSLLLGSGESEAVMQRVRPARVPLVDDWGCLKKLVNTYERHCGRLSRYGMKHSRALANLCNAGVSEQQMAVASVRACSNKSSVVGKPVPGL